MDIQLVVERRKRLQIQTLVLIVTLLKSYQNYGSIWLEICMTYGWIHQHEKYYYQKTSGWKCSIEGSYCKLTIFETATNSVEQYDRRNNIDITGIPDNVEDKNLEHSVIEIFKAADIQISHNDVEDSHRIEKSKGNSKRTIVRLVNRKYCKQILYNRRKLKNFDRPGIGMSNTKIFVNENWTNFNYQLAFNCRKLKREKLISKTYSLNGINHTVQILGNKLIKVFHQSKLDELFSDFIFDGLCGEAPKVADESVWVIFHLPSKIGSEFVEFCSCVCLLLLFFFNDRFFSRSDSWKVATKKYHMSIIQL